MTIPPHAARPGPVPKGISPRIEALRHAPTPQAVDALWAALERDGSPLVEGDGPARDFTFVHRGEAKRVALVTNKIVDDSTYREALMERIGGTDLWALTLRLGEGWRGSYALAVDDGGEPTMPASELAQVELRRARSLSVTPEDRHRDVNAWYDLLRFTRPDPHARGSSRLGSVAAGPAAPAPLDLGSPTNAGRLVDVSTPGRPAWWHLPAVSPGPRGWDVLVLLDGDRWVAEGTDRLDAWSASGIMPPTATLLLGHGELDTRVTDLTCNPALVGDILALLDAAPSSLGAPVARTAERTTIAGQSLGGLTALYAQCLHPRRFGASVCQSGSFWWPNPAGGEPAEWLTRAIRGTETRLGRVYLEVGLAEWVLLEPTRRLRDVLAGRCELLEYLEYDGGHDQACWQITLPRALRAVTAR